MPMTPSDFTSPNAHRSAGSAGEAPLGLRASRCFEFPTARTLGRLYCRPWEPAALDVPWNGWRRLAEARGAVMAPAGHEIQLVINHTAADDLTPLAALPPESIQVLRFTAGAVVADDPLRHLTGLTGLYALALEQAALTPDGLRAVAALAGLRHLHLGTLDQPPDAGIELASLAGLRDLETFDGSGTRVSDAGIDPLAPLQALERLDVRDTHVSETGRARLRHMLPNCWTVL
jgi:hypothetical protein